MKAAQGPGMMTNDIKLYDMQQTPCTIVVRSSMPQNKLTVSTYEKEMQAL